MVFELNFLEIEVVKYFIFWIIILKSFKRVCEKCYLKYSVKRIRLGFINDSIICICFFFFLCVLIYFCKYEVNLWYLLIFYVILCDILRIYSVIYSDWCSFLNDWEMIVKIIDILDNCEKYWIYDKKFLFYV